LHSQAQLLSHKPAYSANNPQNKPQSGYFVYRPIYIPLIGE